MRDQPQHQTAVVVVTEIIKARDETMRLGLLIMSTILSSVVVIAPALALQATDTMQAWKSASDKERSDLLKELLGKPVDNAKIFQCMTETSKTPEHGGLPIGEVAKACASAHPADQPV